MDALTYAIVLVIIPLFHIHNVNFFKLEKNIMGSYVLVTFKIYFG